MTEDQIRKLEGVALDREVGKQVFLNVSEDWDGLSRTDSELLVEKAKTRGIPVQEAGYRTEYFFDLPTGRFEVSGDNKTQALCRALLLHKLKEKERGKVTPP